VALDEVQDWGGIAIAHLRLEESIETPPTPENPDGRLYPVAFLDSHVELLSRADAERVISRSIQTRETLRNGGTPPADRAMVQRLGLIAGSIRAYAAANSGRLSADLGQVLEFIPETRLTATPALRARVLWNNEHLAGFTARGTNEIPR